MMARARSALLSALAAALLGPPGAAAAEEAPSPPRPSPAAPVGEKPEAPTAEEVTLRDQGVLLRRNQVTLELGVAYGRSERDFGDVQVELQQASAELALRYGLWNDLQLSARLPWRAQRARAFAPPPTPGAPAAQEAPGARPFFGDLAVSLFGVALREGPGRPNLILSLDGLVPTGPGDAGIGGGLALTTSHDPVILFAGISYLYGLRTNVANLDRALAQHNFGFNVGYAFAVNEAVALNGQLIGGVRSYRADATPHLARERYRLQLGVTWLVTRTLFVEPTVAVAVGAASPDLTLGVSVPWSP